MQAIIVADLNGQHRKCLVVLFKRFKQAIGWTIANIVGISPNICSQKIQHMPDHKQSIVDKRRLNPPIQEVAKKVIIKWLDDDIMYSIVDSIWVCTIQCVLRKGRMTVIPNE